MSLVNDALKKAQREAAARDAREKGLPEPLAAAAAQPFRSRGRRRNRSAPLALVLTLVAIAVLGAAVYWFLGSEPSSSSLVEQKSSIEGKATLAGQPLAGREGGAEAAPGARPEPGREGGAAGSTSPSDTVAAAAPGAGPEGVASENGGEAASPSPPGRGLATQVETAPPSMAAVDDHSPRASAPDSPPASERRESISKPAPSPQLEESFVREAPLGGGRALRLGGIAWSETAPLVYLNGRLLGVGESVEGCTVRRILRSSIKLACAERALTLTLY